jgi:hypothetical protein
MAEPCMSYRLCMWYCAGASNFDRGRTRVVCICVASPAIAVPLAGSGNCCWLTLSALSLWFVFWGGLTEQLCYALLTGLLIVSCCTCADGTTLCCLDACHPCHPLCKGSLGLYPQPNAHHPPPSPVEKRGSNCRELLHCCGVGWKWWDSCQVRGVLVTA